jgi:phage host-nuclease inhibitor protein Gam
MKQVSDLHKNEISNAVAGMNTASMDIDRLENEIEEKIAELNEAIHRYNNMLKNVDETRKGVLQQIEDYMEKQTDDWRSGDEGETYTGWHDDWTSLDTDPLELIDDIKVDNHEHHVAIDELSMKLE